MLTGVRNATDSMIAVGQPSAKLGKTIARADWIQP
jgi:hypothetical protein